MPSYKEVNPGIFTTVTFPFLFGVMFGDIGHGFGLFLMGFLLYYMPKNFSEKLIKIRSLLILMGFFACFCGFIYNDFLALPFPISPSCYHHKGDKIIREPNCNYPLGLDYSWHHSSNAVSFINSMKMKMSIVIGVIHMMIGIGMKGFNDYYFGRFAGFFLDFIP